MNKRIIFISLIFPLLLQAQTSYNSRISIANNAWFCNNQTNVLNSRNKQNWSSPKDVIRTFFYVMKPTTQEVALELHSTTPSVIKVKALKKTYKIRTGTEPVIALGKITFPKKGYYFIDVQGISRSGESYGEFKNILMYGDASAIKYINEDTYFGRRGPSVHFNYTIPDGISETEWYYSEIEVPKGQDVIGSYYMANGFGEGYFGIQVNSPTERRVLFSVWSPFHTDDPNAIPDEDKIILLKKGENVHSGEFGNEGSGGQSFMRFPWKAGVRYGFLLRGVPDGKNNTTYTAWFHDPATKQWMLMASFKRPKTNTFLKRFHSFLENFIPDQGDKTRMAIYTNQWVADSKGNWYPITEATFTYDATAHAQRRFDYAGGILKKGFFLKMGGFFSENTTFRSKFTNISTGKKPDINLDMFK